MDIEPTTVQKKKISRGRMMLYGMGDLASQFVWTFTGTYLTVFYTDVVGLAPGVVSVIMLCARLWDGINDPMMGSVAERTKSKWGRFRPYILFGTPFLAAATVLTFTAPFGNGTAGVAWAAVTYVVAGMLYTLVNIPYGALPGVMTEDANERNELNAWRSAGMNVGMIIVNFCSSFIMLRFSEGSEVATGRGYFATAVIYAIISVPMFFAVFASSREIIKVADDKRKVPIKETFKNIVGNKYLMLLFGIMVLQMSGFMGRIALTSYYVIYCLGAFTLIALLMTIPSIGGVIGSMLVVPLVRRFGKIKMLAIPLVVQGIALLIIYFADFDNLPLIVFGHILFGLFNMGAPITLSMIADAVDYQELKTGIRTDGTAYATYGLATKLGNAIGASVGLIIMGYFGYQANAQQTPEALQGINLVTNLLPAFLFFAAAGLCFFWKMSDSDADTIRKQLDERRVEQTLGE
ncbi:MFS transporter [Enterococcus sp. MJM16]|uniref:MFS transporter n=2 Tax=Enterococcus TaxID=1350 RepID=A0ABS3HIC7_9ENTE|nr:MFS transporter [Enterococcus sp. MJM16]